MRLFLLPGSGHPELDALGDNAALKFSEAGDHLEKEFALGSGGVDLLLVRDEIYTLSLERGEGIRQRRE